MSASRQKRPLDREYAHDENLGEGTVICLRTRVGNPGMDTTARHVESWRLNNFEGTFHGRGESFIADSFVQNIPFGFARGMFGAINGAEFFGSPTICKVSQCSIALPSASIL
jgi:hypothetical protein